MIIGTSNQSHVFFQPKKSHKRNQAPKDIKLMNKYSTGQNQHITIMLYKVHYCNIRIHERKLQIFNIINVAVITFTNNKTF